ncbi:MAG: ABC transporter permease [Acholeplasma sp.]|nr:ABC transporter permease [Acholeplasma sp.]
MFQVSSLVKRNVKIFLRDKTAVFFSFLSVIILMGLYFLFLNNTYTNGLPEELGSKKINFLALSQMMGGVLVVNTITLSLGMMGNIVNDFYFKKTESFLVTPVKRSKIFISYVISTLIITFTLSLFMWFLTIGYAYISTGYIYSFKVIINISLLLLLYTGVSTAIMLFIIGFIKSVNAFGTVSGIFGTLVGFVSGIYMPLAILPKGVSYFSSLVPFTHMTILMKQQILEKPLQLIENEIPIEGLTEIKQMYGVNEIGVLGIDVNMFLIFIGIIAVASTLFLITIKKLSKNK